MQNNSDGFILHGEDEAINKMKKETMDMAPNIRVTHNYYGTEEFNKKKMKQVEDVKKNSGYEVGYEGKTSHYNAREDDDDDKRDKKAGGGAIGKLRKDYPGV